MQPEKGQCLCVYTNKEGSGGGEAVGEHFFNNCTLLSFCLGGLGKEGVTEMPLSVREMPFRVESWGGKTSSGSEMCGVRVRIEIGHRQR